jgi:hypothetical protein
LTAAGGISLAPLLLLLIRLFAINLDGIFLSRHQLAMVVAVSLASMEQRQCGLEALLQHQPFQLI